jgi:NAD kinase
MFDKLVVVTRKTRLAELIERFNTREQARFYIEHAGGDFGEYLREDDTYRRSLEHLRRQLDGLKLKLQLVDRSLVPTFLFAESDLVVTVGQDGLVANTARYVGAQPIVAINPDPERFDGVLLPFRVEQALPAVERTLASKAAVREVTLAEAKLEDGQKLVAFNDLFLGARTHVSARYRLQVAEKKEEQSSSGLLVSTGAGSTGWMSSVFNMAFGVSAAFGGRRGRPTQLTWEDQRLIYVVREPFVSRHSAATLISGLLAAGNELVIESRMPSGGVIFGDGVEADFLEFNSGAMAHIHAAPQRARLVVPSRSAT